MHLGVQKLNLDIFTLAPPPKKNFPLGSYHTPEANGNYSSPQAVFLVNLTCSVSERETENYELLLIKRQLLIFNRGTIYLYNYMIINPVHNKRLM